MAKMTAKYSAALAAARKLKLSTSGNQETVYQRLMGAGHFWDSKKQVWQCLENEPAQPARNLLHIRVWAPKGEADQFAQEIMDELPTRVNIHFVEKSIPYPCRPPKQNEERVYLTFRIGGK